MSVTHLLASNHQRDIERSASLVLRQGILETLAIGRTGRVVFLYMKSVKRTVKSKDMK
jgi:hypothetical protein